LRTTKSVKNVRRIGVNQLVLKIKEVAKHYIPLVAGRFWILKRCLAGHSDYSRCKQGNPHILHG
jgi:hypothetical protein